jgi:TRAP-type transport system periplasmic protein
MRLGLHRLALVTIAAALATSAATLGQSTNRGKRAAVRIDMGTIAPKDTPWYEILERIQSEWRKQGVELNIRNNVGDEEKMLRTVALHGGLDGLGISGTGLARIAPGVRALQIPLMVDSYQQLDHVLEGLRPRLERDIESSRTPFIVLNWSDVGFIRFFSKKPIHTPDQLKQVKLFTSAGDQETEKLYRNLGFTPTPIAITEMLLSLNLGFVDAFDVPPLFALSDESFSQARNMIDLKWAPIVGATIITREAWQRIPEELRPNLLQSARAAGAEFQADIRAMEDKAIARMQANGLNVVKLTPAEAEQWRHLAVETAYPKLRGEFIPEDYFKEAERLSKEFAK